MKRVENRHNYLSQLSRREDKSQIESELNNLVTKQLLPDATLRGFCSSSNLPVKTFTHSTKLVDSLSSIEGISNAREYKDKLGRQERENGLLQDGLSSEEVLILLNETGYGECYPRNPSVLEAEKKELRNKIDKKRESIQQQSTSVNTRLLSRHELELELSAHGTESHPLRHLLATDPMIASERDSLLLQESLQQLEARTEELCRKRHKSIDNASCKRLHVTEERIEETDLNEDNPQPENPRETSFTSSQDIKQIDPAHVRRYRLSLSEIKRMPRFSNYAPGTPSSKLFIKNLHRTVTLTDLASLLIKFQQETGPALKFRLLSGRMKGQAFVEFPNVATATEALYYSNGYILKGKPLIVAYSNNTRS